MSPHPYAAPFFLGGATSRGCRFAEPDGVEWRRCNRPESDPIHPQLDPQTVDAEACSDCQDHNRPHCYRCRCCKGRVLNG